MEGIIGKILKVPVVELFNYSVLLFILLLGYAVVKYKFFIITPQSVADKVIKSLGEGLLVIDHEGIINIINSRAIQILGLKGEFKNRKINNIFKLSQKNWTNVFKDYTENNKLHQEIEFKGKGKNKKNILFSFSDLSNGQSGLGHIILIRDITKEKNNLEKIKENNDVLNRMNKMLVGREKRIIELKKELSDCKT